MATNTKTRSIKKTVPARELPATWPEGCCAPELDLTICGTVGLLRAALRTGPGTKFESSEAIVIGKFRRRRGR
jgi:hypothetical protein